MQRVASRFPTLILRTPKPECRSIWHQTRTPESKLGGLLAGEMAVLAGHQTESAVAFFYSGPDRHLDQKPVVRGGRPKSRKDHPGTSGRFADESAVSAYNDATKSLADRFSGSDL